MAKKKSAGGAQFDIPDLILDALRRLGGSGAPDEVVEQIVDDYRLKAGRILLRLKVA